MTLDQITEGQKRASAFQAKKSDKSGQ